MNKRKIITKIKELDSLSKEERNYLVNLINYSKRYGLVWENKPEKMEEELRTKLPILKEIKEKAIINDTEKQRNPNHVLIEGDNLHALTTLTFTHENKIDLIYIDPPYNTGNKDFVYNDSFVDKDDDYKHSKWLSFMNKRLKIAKRLLSNSGLLFVSIDDIEYAQLKILLDEIFNNNLINSITVKTSETSGVKMSHTEKKLPKIKEYLLIYSLGKNPVQLNPVRIEKNNDFNKLEKYAKYYSKIILNPEEEPEKWNIVSINDYFKQKNIKKTKEELLEFKLKNADRVIYRTTNKSFNGLNFPTKTAKVISATGIKYIWWEGKQMLFLENHIQEGLCDLWTDISTINLNKEICELPTFKNGQKPIELIQRIIKLIPKKNITLLDFFAGSGTSLHALMEQNKQDNQTRKAIIITNNENNIAEEITYERNKRVIEGYTDKTNNQISGLKNNNLRYYKCDFAERKPTLKNKQALTRLSTELLCIKEECYYEISSQINNEKWNKLFTDKHKLFTYVIYNDMFIEDAVNNLKTFIKKKNYKIKIKVYVFSHGQYPYTDDFDDIIEYVELCALPDVIYKAYLNVLPKISKL